jgi:hypothetical protein
MHYHTVFDISGAGYRSASLRAFGLILVALGGMMAAWHRRQVEAGKGRRNTLLALLLLSLAVFWTATMFGSAYRQCLALLQARDGGQYGVVEGAVSDLQAAAGGAAGRFCVQAQCFGYPGPLAAALGGTRSHGGPIREGSPVRVTYAGERIIRLEVAR